MKKTRVESMLSTSIFPGKAMETSASNDRQSIAKQALSKEDFAAASSFADACYDENLKMPSIGAMKRLETAGVVVQLENGAWAETPRLRELGL